MLRSRRERQRQCTRKCPAFIGDLTADGGRGYSTRLMAAPPKALASMLAEVLAPLVEADGGELYFVSADDDNVALHVGGSWSGSPAVVMATDRIITPAVTAVRPGVSVAVTYGWSAPEGAERIEPAE